MLVDDPKELLTDAERPSPVRLRVLPRPQKSLARSARVTGIGFVTGADVTLTFRPAPPDTGIVFVRADLENKPEIPARLEHLLHSDRRTALAIGQASVEMTEHALAALIGLGIDNCRIEMDAGELPAGDGSSLLFVEALEKAGTLEQSATTTPIVITESIILQEGSASIAIHPSADKNLTIQYDLEYANPGIGKQSHAAKIDGKSFKRELAPARTFVLAQEVDALRAQGIGTRHSAKDLVVFAPSGDVIDNALRFPDECARHKALDVLGDLALAGRPIIGQVVARKSGHRHNVALAQKILDKCA